MNTSEETNRTLDLVPSESENGDAATAATLELPAGHSYSRRPLGVRMMSQSGSGFSKETASLLRTRLLGYAVITLAVLAIGFVGSLLNPQPLFLLRFIILLVVLSAALLLRGKRELSLQQLRSIETVTVSSLLLQVCLMSWLRIEWFVNNSDLPSTVGATQMLYTLICLVIMAYGIFIPNTWKRAAIILLPIAAIPSVLLAAMESTNPTFSAMAQYYELAKPIPETLVAAFIAIFASHVIQGVRREAFEAKQLGQYVLGERIGSGGMGEVYKAEHRMLKRPCAIKLIRPGASNTAKSIDRFEIEVRATAKLSHWNSVEVYDYGRTDDGTFYYVMELLPGLNLEQIVNRTGAMPAGRVVHFLAQVCDALHEAHAQDLIHRDIKPANIFAARRGGVDDVAKLLDFGLVRHTDNESDQSRSFSGTPEYMPPEQATNYEQVDARGDIYALGAVAFFLLTGAPPFQGSIQEILLMHQNRKPEVLSRRGVVVSPDLDECVGRCLAKSPDDRWQSVDDLRDALEACPEAGTWSDSDASSWWQQNAMKSPPVQDTTSTQPLSGTLEMPATIDSAPFSRD